MQRFEGRRVLVTGAGSGIGQGVAVRFASEGARVLLADVALEGVERTAALIADGARTRAVHCDVTDGASVAAAVAAAEEWMGGVDVAVTCAGVLGRGPVLELTPEDWDRVLDINLKGTFLTAQAAARQMVRQGGGGCIITISSTQAEVANADQVHYTASKGGVRQLTKALAAGLAEHGIRVNAIGPGPVRTGFNAHRMDDPELLPWYLDRVLLGRVGQPEDVAGVAAFLASDDAAWMTGTTVYVEGGMLATRGGPAPAARSGAPDPV